MIRIIASTFCERNDKFYFFQIQNCQYLCVFSGISARSATDCAVYGTIIHIWHCAFQYRYGINVNSLYILLCFCPVYPVSLQGPRGVCSRYYGFWRPCGPLTGIHVLLASQRNLVCSIQSRGLCYHSRQVFTPQKNYFCSIQAEESHSFYTRRYFSRRICRIYRTKNPSIRPFTRPRPLSSHLTNGSFAIRLMAEKKI